MDKTPKKNNTIKRAFLDKLISEYLKTGNKARIVIDISNGEIDYVQNQEMIAGISQFTYYLRKL